MTDKTPEEVHSPSRPREPGQAMATESAAAPAEAGVRPSEQATEEPVLPRRRTVKVDRFPSRQSGFTVPKPSYLRHGDIDELTAGEVISGDDQYLPEPEHASEDDAPDPATVARRRRRQTIRLWVYLLLTLVFMFVYRMHGPWP